VIHDHLANDTFDAVLISMRFVFEIEVVALQRGLDLSSVIGRDSASSTISNQSR